MFYTGGVLFYWGVMDIEHEKEVLLNTPELYKPGIQGKLFNTKVFWSWNIYAMYQALLVLFIGMVSTQDSPLPDGKTYSFWAGGHIVYFECVLIVNLVILRASHNIAGYGEFVLFLQVTSFFWILYIASVFFTKGVVAYFFDEFFSSWTA